jgi:hypothetical protein
MILNSLDCLLHFHLQPSPKKFRDSVSFLPPLDVEIMRVLAISMHEVFFKVLYS